MENKEYEAFLKWHFDNWKLNCAHSDSVDEAKKIYERIYQNNKPIHVAERERGFMAWKAGKAQAVPETHIVVPKELHTEIALNMARERILKQPLGKDPVWNELVEQAYKDNLQAEKCRLIRDYREMIKASESGAEG